MNREKLRKQVDELLRSGKYDEVKPWLLLHKDITEHDSDLTTVCYLCTIYEQEQKAGQETLFSKVSNTYELLERYTVLKFYLRRMEFDVMEEMESFYLFLTQNRVSPYEIMRVIDFSVVHKEKVLQAINNGAAIYKKDENMEQTADVAENEDEPDAMHQFCFILCTNHPAYAAECTYYIRHLNVPEGIGVDILTVEEAKSLAAGYNEAMRFSKAKYKVYLHQDTFIINPDFIRNCLEIFEENPQIGMIGNIGVKKMPASGVMWEGERYGMLYEQHIYETKLCMNPIAPGLRYMEMDAVDGFVMVTQYDLLWREDLFDKWDFYDCSQSREFIRKGYQVVIPNMREPWCVHDCGFLNLKDYEIERQKFVTEYLS